MIEFSNVIRRRWGSQDAVSSATCSWQSHAWGSRGKTPVNVWSFHNWRTNEQLKLK